MIDFAAKNAGILNSYKFSDMEAMRWQIGGEQALANLRPEGGVCQAGKEVAHWISPVEV